MEAFIVLVALALTLAVVQNTVGELVPVKIPAALDRFTALVIAVGFCYAIDYSAFTAFGQSLRTEWMHPVVTGLVLVAIGEFVRSIVSAIAHRAGEAPVEVAPSPTAIRAA